MSIRQICAKRLILAVDPHAFDEGTLLAEVERNEQRIANDPEIQERKRLVNEKATGPPVASARLGWPGTPRSVFSS